MPSRYTPKDYRYAKLYRTLSYPHYEINDPFDMMDQDSKNKWVDTYLSGDYESGYEDAMKRVHQIASQENKLEKNEKNEEKVETKNNQYTFIAAEDDIDTVDTVDTVEKLTKEQQEIYKYAKMLRTIHMEEKLKKAKEERVTETETKNNQYTFIAAEDDVEYDRILRESPKGSQFILVEERTRTNQAVRWSLFVHQTVLSNPKVSGISLGDEGTRLKNKTVGPEWGYNDILGTQLYSYRVISGPGAVPGYVRKTIDHIKRALNPKDTRVVVSIF